MPSELIKNLENAGKLRRQSAGLEQVEALLREAIADLLEAKKIIHLAERATYIMAYNAILKAGRALLLIKGYRPVDGAQHKTIVELTSEFLGKPYQDLTDHFEFMRRKRHEVTYEAGFLLSKSETQKAFVSAQQLVKGILSDVKKKNPQLELSFEKNFEKV